MSCWEKSEARKMRICMTAGQPQETSSIITSYFFKKQSYDRAQSTINFKTPSTKLVYSLQNCLSFHYVHTRNFKKFPRLLGIIMPKKAKFPKPR